MPWVRKDDQMPINRKVAALSDAAYRLDDEAICWASRNLTDGRIPADDLASVSKRATRKNAAELVRRGRWHRAEDPKCLSEHCPEPGPDGWVIHDYLEYNPSREQVLAERKAKAERQARWRARRRGGSASTDTSTNASRNPSLDALVDGAGDALVTHAPRAHVSRPVPSRPAPPRKEAGGGAPASAQSDARPARRQAADAAGGPWDEPPVPPPSRTRASPQTVAAAAEQARQAIAEARARRRGPADRDALAELRELTPDLPPAVELGAAEPPSTEERETP